jgi:hypothetical protein
MKADAGVALATGPAAAACDVERNRYEVAHLEILDIAISVRDCVRTRVIQTIVKVQLQLGVRAAGWRLDRRHDRHD